MNIRCKAKGLLLNHDNKVWPCCYVCTNFQDSRYLKKLDKDWNSLNKHTLKEILSTDAYRFHFNDADWNDENLVDQICKDYCNIDEKN